MYLTSCKFPIWCKNVVIIIESSFVLIDIDRLFTLISKLNYEDKDKYKTIIIINWTNDTRCD